MYRNNTMQLLNLKGVNKFFGSVAAVQNFDLEIRKGEIRGLIGPNGAGKSTLFNLVSGFLRPERGKIFLEGHEITGLSPHNIARHGLVRTFQLTSLFNETTVLENVLMAFHRRYRFGILHQLMRSRKARSEEKEMEGRATELLEMMGIGHIKGETAGDLPLGFQRILGVAIALAVNPKLLLLDEPAAGLNPKETSEMMQQIRSVRSQGVTVVLVEHDMKAVMNTCETLTVMDFGKKIAEGPPEEIITHPRVIEAYLGN